MASKKKFIEVEVPSLNTTLSVLGTPESLDKKTIKIDLTRKMKGKSVEAILKILNKDGILKAYPKKLQLMKFYIKRMLRKRVDYVEDSFIAKAADVRVILKPFLITRKRISRVVRKNLRNTSREFLIEYVKELNYIDLCHKILSGELQKTLLPKLKKIYPLSFCDLRVFETKEIEKANLELNQKEVKKEIEKPKDEKTEKVSDEKPVKTKKSDEKKADEKITEKKDSEEKKKTTSKKEK